MLEAELLYRLQAWSLGEPWEASYDKDAVLIFFFLTSLESAGSQIALGSPGMTDIAREETPVQTVRFSSLTVMFPGCSWVSPESGSLGWLTLGLLS